MKKQLLSLILILLISMQTNAQVGAALNFDGANDYAQNASAPNMPLMNSFTIESWVNLNNTTNGKIFSSNEMEFAVITGGQLQFYCPAFSGNTTNTVTVGTGVWQHVAATYNGSKLSFFVNGVLSGTFVATGSISANTGFKIGQHVSAGCCLVSGSLDELKIWNRALCQGEIQNNMNAQLLLPQTGLVSYYQFNQGVASNPNPGVTTLMDASGNSNNAVLTNFALTGPTSNWIAPGAVITGSTAAVFSSTLITVASGSVTSGASFTLTPSGGTSYSYSPAGPIVTPSITSTYTVSGTATNGCFGKAVSTVSVQGAALNFDGLNDRVDLGNAITNNLAGSSMVSVEAWVRPTSLSGLGCIIGNYSTGFGALQVLLRRSFSGYYEFWIGNGGSWYNTNSVATPTLNVWQHVAATWDGTEASIYVNGVLSGKTTPPISTLGNASGNSVWLGGNTINESFTGDIDEVRIWNVNRTQCDIISNMNCEIASATPGLLANYHFNQGFDAVNNSTVTSLTDDSGNSNTGTLTSFALTGATSNWVAPGGVVSGFTTTATCSLAAAINFDGADDYVTIPSGINIANQSFTIEFWAKRNGSGNGGFLFGQQSTQTTNNSLHIGFRNTDAFTFAFYGNDLDVTHPATTDGNMHHWACVYNSGQSGIDRFIYLDGVLIASDDAPADFSGSGPFYIGNLAFGGDYFNGTMDEVRIWNIARTQCQINTYKDSEIPGASAGLLANYHFNQGVIPNSNSTVTTLNDATSNSNNGTLNNFALTGSTSNWVAPGAVVSGFTTTSTSSFCPPAEALNLDGIDDFVDLGTPANLPVGNSAYTIEAKIKPTVLGVEGIVGWGNYGNTGQSNALRLDPFGNIVNYWWGPDLVVSASPINLLDGNWHHIAATFDGTTRSIFVDGVLKGSDTPGSSHTVPAMNVRIGSTCTLCGGEYFNGGIDEVRIWNVGRSQCDVISYMNCEIPSTATGLVANYHFNQGLDGTNNATVTTLTDASGNSNNGTLTNFALAGATSNWIAPGGVISGSVTPAICNLAAALDFDGSDDFVRVSDNSSLDFGSGDFTIESWVNKKASSSGYQNTGGINKWNTGGMSGTNEWLLSLTNSGNDDVPAFWIESGTTIYQCPAVTPLTLNTWAHIAAVREGTDMKIYVNGVLENTVNIGNVSVNDVGRDVLIGAIENGFFANMNADNTRIWNVARTQCDIRTYMNAEIPGSATGLLINYNFNQGVDAFNNSLVTTVMDASGNSNNGMLNNFALNGVTSNWIAPGAVVSGFTTTTITSPTISVNSGAICAGQSFTMTPGGAVTYTYSSGTDVVTPTADATYSVSGTDANGCVSSTDAVSSVTVNVLPTISVNSGAICAGQSFTMVPSGATTYTYSSGTDVVMPTSDATYSVSGTDANGCLSSMDAVSSVTVNALPTISVNSGAICAGQSFTMTPNGAVTYTYSNGSDVTMPTADATYIVMGTDVNGCENTAVASVTVNALPAITVNSGTICSGQSFTMTPNGAVTFTYSNGSDVTMPTADATYTVTGTDVNGCENMATSSVTVNALPVLSATSTSTLMCTGETATLSVSGASTYTWSTTETSMAIVITPTAQTTYTVEGTDANGCMNTTTITQDVSLCTGIVSLSGTGSAFINVYPNPTNGLFTIELSSMAEVSVSNTLGQIIMTEKMDNGKHNLSIQNQPFGIYFVKVIQDRKQQVIKLIKE